MSVHQRLMLLVGALPEEMRAHGHSVAELIEAETAAAVRERNTIERRITHVWDVDGRPRGVMHRLTLRGETLVAEDVGLDEHGEPLDVGADRAEIPFVEAVHVLLNATPEERARLGVERTQRPADPTRPLAEQVLTMVHAFSDSGRKDAVRSLAAQVAAMEADHARLARDVERLSAVIAEDLGHPGETAAEAVRRTVALLVAGDEERARLAARVDAYRAGGLGAECDSLRAEVERLTRERDAAQKKADRWDAGQRPIALTAERLAKLVEQLTMERDALAAEVATLPYPSDLAATRDARVRAEALREGARLVDLERSCREEHGAGPEQIGALLVAVSILRSEAKRIEGGGR